jgi:hypothetical protein
MLDSDFRFFKTTKDTQELSTLSIFLVCLSFLVVKKIIAKRFNGKVKIQKLKGGYFDYDFCFPFVNFFKTTKDTQ